MFFFFKQKTAYEMRISDWSSDVWLFRSASGSARIRGEPQQHGLQYGAQPGAGDGWPAGRHLRRGGRFCRQRRFLYRRSEEHTSELQSLMRISYAGFCLKKKTYTNTTPNTSSPLSQITSTVSTMNID